MSTGSSKICRYYSRASYATFSVLILLLFAGILVRVTESGMGCPDWPKCFGKVIPPTHHSELPENYKGYFLEIRKEKTDRLVRTLESLGLSALAEKVKTQKTKFEAQDFSFYTAWIEYANRLVSVLYGIVLMVQVVLSIVLFRKGVKKYFGINMLLLLATIIQALIGSFVVYTDLLPGVVSFHLLFTLVIIALNINSILPHKPFNISVPLKNFKPILLVAMLVSLVQMFIGTDVREEIEHLVKEMNLDRTQWLEGVKDTLLVHTSFAWVVLLANAYLIYKILKNKIKSAKPLVYGIGGILAMQFLSGVSMDFFHFPPFFRLLHMILAFGLFMVQYFFLSFGRTSK